MCAIAGIICLNDECRFPDHGALVEAMCDVQTHRGPNDRGTVGLGSVYLGSNRLSILDLSPAGHMPMSDGSGRWWIAYNGEAYNYQAVRAELIERGRVFQSGSDTEVVLQAFAEWGEACLDRLVGMFAFAVVDRDTNTVTLVRDRFGKKPLYWTERDGHIVFASEVTALLHVGGPVRTNFQRLIEWSLYRNAEFGSPETLVEGVNALAAGYMLVVRNGRLENPRRYYNPAAQVTAARYTHLARRPEATVIDEVDGLIHDSIRARLVSDVPVGTLCSGGIDSSLVTAISARHVPDIAAFHVSVTGYEDLDESRYARQVTDALGLRLHTYSLSGEEFRRTLPRAIYHSDFPLTHPNSVAFLLVSEFARARGVTILLSGEAADELFGGYMHRYRQYRHFLRAQRLFERLPARLRKIMALLGHAAERVPATAFGEYPGLLPHTTSMIDKFAREDLRLACEEAYAFISDPDDRALLGAMLADLTNFLAPLLRRLDRMSMAASIECRTPFLDHRLVELALNLPLDYRLRGGTDKWVLKQVAARYIPREVVHRRKVGFPLPVRDYLLPLAHPDLFVDGFCVNALGMHRRGLLEAIASWEQNVHGFFNLLALEIWGRMFVLRESIAQVEDRLARATRKAA